GGGGVEAAYKTTIGHGFLTLSLLSVLARQALTVGGVRMAINYGLNKVRFVSPVPSGARIRGRFTVAAIEDVHGAVQVTWRGTLEREGGDKPRAVAEWIVRDYRDRVENCWGGASLRPCEERGRALAAAHAHRPDAVPRPAALHLVRDRADQARAGHAERMADRDRSAVHVQPLHRNAEPVAAVDHLRRERF